jgi:hypothetical protein
MQRLSIVANCDGMNILQCFLEFLFFKKQARFSLGFSTFMEAKWPQHMQLAILVAFA